MVSIRKLLILLVVCASSSCSTTWQRVKSGLQMIGGFDQASASNERTYRALQLDNKMQVLLIHDPKAKKSATSIDVAVGSLQDPWEHQGLAHFLEHMLFLGTKKYPDAEDYLRYLIDHQGSHNAYTAREHTNYFFEVNHEGFRGALDRFGQFFIAPLFADKYTERELQAVNSEHQKNLQNDFWRRRQVNRLTSRQGHARQKFSTGNAETLRKASQDRKIFLDFYQRYYSANAMRLAVLSRLSLNEQERLVRGLFSKVNNNNRAKLVYDSKIFDERSLPQLLMVEPVKDLKLLSLNFATPSSFDYWRSKPSNLLGSLIGDEGPGSLLSLLKAKGYATALSAGDHSFSFAAEFNVTITLTDKGLAQVNDVISIFFSYVAQLKKHGLPRYYYDEQRQLAQIAYDYRDPMIGMDAVSWYSRMMQRFPALDTLPNYMLYFDYRPDDFKLFLDRLSPLKLKAIVSAKGVSTDKVEKFYGVKYSVTKFQPSVYQAWQQPTDYKELHYPPPNPYVPENLKVLADEKVDVPYKLLDTKQGVFWFQQDSEFLLPKAQLYLNVFSDQVNSSTRAKLLSILYVRSFREQINEWLYQVMLAGVSIGIVRNNFGIGINLMGYSDKIPQLLVDVGKQLPKLTIDEVRFEAIRKELQRELKNLVYSATFRLARHDSANILAADNIDYRQYRQLVSKVTRTEVIDYGKKLWQRVGYEGIAYGNLDSKILSKAVGEFFVNLAGGRGDKAILPEDNRGREKTLKFDKNYSYSEVVPTNNHALASNRIFGKRTPLNEGIMQIVDTHVGSRFFTQLRTEQQLGYVVFSRVFRKKHVVGMEFIVQSSRYDPLAINDRLQKFTKMMTDELTTIALAELDGYRHNVIESLQAPEKSIFERHTVLKARALILDGNFSYRQQIIDTLQKLTTKDLKQQVQQAWQKLSSVGQLSVAMFAHGSKARPIPGTVAIDNIADFKANYRSYYQQ